MTLLTTESIKNPLQKSKLSKKGLCDYVINIASGCLHGCTFCYVPSTPAIRTRQPQLKERGVNDPQMEWGKYLFARKDIPELLDRVLSRKKTWQQTPSGKGVVLLCSGTDPYQNQQTASIARQAVEILLKHDKKIRILTRSPLWTQDLDLLVNPNITVGMSLPHLDDELSRKLEPGAPLPSRRYEAMKKGDRAGCRLYLAMAPTPPTMTESDFATHLEKLMAVNPEVIFWEPINARGNNSKRMELAGIEFAKNISDRRSWEENFNSQWDLIESAAIALGCYDRIHFWADAQLRDPVKLAWIGAPTIEKFTT